MQVERFVARLAAARIGGTYNFYRHGERASLRRRRLRRYLEPRAETRLLLVGEAAGYRGARVSGIPFTSERQLTGTGPAEATAIGNSLVQALAQRRLGSLAEIRAVVAASARPTVYQPRNSAPFAAAADRMRRLTAGT